MQFKNVLKYIKKISFNHSNILFLILKPNYSKFHRYIFNKITFSLCTMRRIGSMLKMPIKMNT